MAGTSAAMSPAVFRRWNRVSRVLLRRFAARTAQRAFPALTESAHGEKVSKEPLTPSISRLNVSVTDITNRDIMTDHPTSPEEMLPLSPAVFHILLALADGERHGYSIMQHVAETTDGRVKMGPGTLYGTVKRLLAAKWIEESDERPDPKLDDERRRYYRLTPWGRRVLGAEVSRYSRMVKAARAIGVATA